MVSVFGTPSTSVALQTAHREGEAVRLIWSDGHEALFQAVWLRDVCPCEECLHPGSGQRLFDTATLQEKTTPVTVSVVDGDLDIAWLEDDHRSRFLSHWLRDHARAEQGAASGRRTLWNAGMQDDIPSARYTDVRDNPENLRGWLAAVDRYGFALLSEVPVEPGTIFDVVDLFGYVRETNYGRLFDVRAVIDPGNLAYTGLALGPHTDNPYRDPTPTLQLLHCLSSSAAGGDNTLVDGFRVAEDLRADDPVAFELLTTRPVLFRYRDAENDLQRETTIITLDARGEIAAIHFNNRSRAPLELPSELVAPYYRAYRRFARMLSSEEYSVRVHLEPGDLLIMDNERVLHGRTGYSAAGERHLQGCYADRDGLRSRLAVLERDRAREGEV